MKTIKLLGLLMILTLAKFSFAQTYVFDPVSCTDSVIEYPIETSCDNVTAKINSRYGSIDFNRPLANTPVKTIRININIFWNGANGPVSDFFLDNQATKDYIDRAVLYLNDRYSNNNKPYTLSLPGVVDLPDSKIRFVHSIYFYPNSNLEFSSSRVDALNYISTNFPSRMNALNLCFTNFDNSGTGWLGYTVKPRFENQNLNSYHQSVITCFGFETPHSLTLSGAGWGIANHLAHEIGHCLDLNHTYNNAYRDPNHSEFLNDVFDVNYSAPTYCTGTVGFICYHNSTYTTNNIMGGQQDAWYISPKQMGKMHRALSLTTMRKYLYEYPYNKIPIEVTTNENWNFDVQLYNDININSGNTVTFECHVSLPDQASIIVNPGATLIVGNGVDPSVITNNYSTAWGGSIIVKPGGTLELKNGAEVLLKGNGKIYAEYDLSTQISGKVIFHHGAKVNLADNYTTIDIAGELEIADNTDFSFTGNGYLRLSRPGWMNYVPNITGGINSRFVINGNGKYDKKVEISQNILGLPDHVPLVITNAAVHIGQWNFVSTASDLHINNARFTSINGTSHNAHGGLGFYGQGNHYINDVVFEYGDYGIRATSTYYGSSLNLTNCVFQFNGIAGLKTVDKGAILNNVSFINNEEGWIAEGMTVNSEMKNSNASNNWWGIRYDGGSTSSLFLEKSTVNSNEIAGVNFSGSSKLSVKCGTINSNGINYISSYPDIFGGIVMQKGSSLNMSPNEVPSAGGVTLSGNNYTINSFCSSFLLINEGRNDLIPASGTFSVVGSFINGTSSCSSINVERNRWSMSSNTKPQSDVHYRINNCGNCYPKPMTLIDNNPLSGPVPYGVCRKPFPVVSPSPNNPSERSPFNDYVPALERIDAGDFIVGMDKFETIINAVVPNLTAREKELQELSYQYIKHSVGEMYNRKLLNNTGSQLNPVVERLVSIQDNKIQQAQVNNDLRLKYNASMEKAQTLVLADKREDALVIFDDVLTWADSTDIDYVQYWKCLSSLEVDLLNGLIAKEEFVDAISTCRSENNSTRQIKSNRQERIKAIEKAMIINETPSNELLLSNKTKLDQSNFKIYPNPNNGTFAITLPLKNLEINVTVYDARGKITLQTISTGETKINIDLEGFAPGLYFVKISDGETVRMEKVIYSK